jgi:hypothetical protein
MDTFYMANQRLRIQNGPGSERPFVTVQGGDIFSLDGTEPLNVERLLAAGAIIAAPVPPNGLNVTVHPDKEDSRRLV